MYTVMHTPQFLRVKSKSDWVCHCRNGNRATSFSRLASAAAGPVNKYRKQSSPSSCYIRETLNPVWDAFTAIWSAVSHCMQHTHIDAHTFHFQHLVPRPVCKVVSIFHNASCNIVRYGPRFHLCGAAAAHLSLLGAKWLWISVVSASVPNWWRFDVLHRATAGVTP